jgi:glutaredoxin|tara:strand:+ start:855 stop:1076 length:222 start_codon:yes stop_codon:yes gene_type:complete
MFKMFTQDGCSYCELAKILFMENDISFEVINIKDNAQALAVLRLKNLRTVPQIWDGDLHIGGYEDLKKYLKKQ